MKAGGGTGLRPGADDVDGAVLSFRHAGRGTDGADGVVHVGHGRQRDGIQHRVHLRHLSGAHPQERAGFALSLGGPRITVIGSGVLHRHGVSGDPFQQHHGFSATGVRLRQRAAVRDISAGNVLEASDRARRVHRTDRRNVGRIYDLQPDGGRRQRRLDSRSPQFPSTMAQNFWIAIIAWVACFLVTMLVSLVTKPKTNAELHNLVYGVTDVPKEPGLRWYQRPTRLL